jgi:hypothetical protein
LFFLGERERERERKRGDAASGKTQEPGRGDGFKEAVSNPT